MIVLIMILPISENNERKGSIYWSSFFVRFIYPKSWGFQPIVLKRRTVKHSKYRKCVHKGRRKDWSTHYARHVHLLEVGAILQRVNLDHHTSAEKRRTEWEPDYIDLRQKKNQFKNNIYHKDLVHWYLIIWNQLPNLYSSVRQTREHWKNYFQVCFAIIILTDSPLAFINVCGLASMIGTSPIRPE
jgi:hypothetical protein